MKSEWPNSQFPLRVFLAFVLLPQETVYFPVDPACVVTCKKYEREIWRMMSKHE